MWVWPELPRIVQKMHEPGSHLHPLFLSPCLPSLIPSLPLTCNTPSFYYHHHNYSYYRNTTTTGGATRTWHDAGAERQSRADGASGTLHGHNCSPLRRRAERKARGHLPRVPRGPSVCTRSTNRQRSTTARARTQPCCTHCCHHICWRTHCYSESCTACP